MKRGIALLELPAGDALAEALTCFDQALAIRRAAPPSATPWDAYLLAASWMNRGDALTRLGSPAQLAEAVHSFDEAIAVLEAIPLDADPRYRRRFAIAWINRGIALQEQGTADSLELARQSFENGIRAMESGATDAVVHACAWMNRANVLVRMGPAQLPDARASAERAIDLLSALEFEDVVAAETALKSRHILCQAIAQDLGADPAAGEPLLRCAIAAIESGLQLARAWEERGETRFRPLASELFRFGALAVQQFRPGALVSFVRDNVDVAQGGPQALEMHSAARAALGREWTTLQREGFSAINTPRLDHWIETLRALRETEERLRKLREG